MFQNVTGETFFHLSEQPDTVILDVRSPEEARMGIIPGAKVINMFDCDFMKKIESLDHSKTYLVYCRSGNRSAQACMIMSQVGFDQLYNLAGGLMSWQGPVAQAS
ncbi:MAG: rhodanese-like domain-containing protein [Lewinellaceae bacterium]|nr:rhodanese-like domain-containing protein [Lewinellaceae bacterium]